MAAAFTLAGFNWFEGLSLLNTHYYQGIASARPYSYFVWANLAALAICAGPALGAGLHRSVRLVLSRRWHDQGRLVPAVLTISALFTIGVADPRHSPRPRPNESGCPSRSCWSAA